MGGLQVHGVTYRFADYLELVAWTGRAVRDEGSEPQMQVPCCQDSVRSGLSACEVVKLLAVVLNGIIKYTIN